MLRQIAQYTATLLGRSAYEPPPPETDPYDIDAPHVLRMRALHGGQIQTQTIPQTRWYLAHLEQAEYDADQGKLELAAKLMRAARTDGVFAGVLSTRTGGLVRLPKRFRGDDDVVAALEFGHGDGGEVRSVFEEMFPPQELAAIAADGILLGCGVGMLVPVIGRDYPVFVRLEPQYLEYDWGSNTWYFRSIAGPLRITPGDGRWILHVPGGRNSPWVNCIWRAIGRAYIRKEHAALHRDNWEGKLANPARVAVAPQGGTEAQAESWFRAVMAWGVNTVFGMRPGYDVKLIESNGRGWESFNKTIDEQNSEFVICVAGQTVTTDGGAGFANADIHKSIRADLIKETADGLAYTINSQGIPAFVAARFGEEAIDEKVAIVEWDVTPPKDRTADAQSLVTTAAALDQLAKALAPVGLAPDIKSLCLRFNVPLVEAPEAEPAAADGGGDVPVAVATGEAAAADTALNGAQVTSLLQVIGQVAAGQLPRETGVAIIVKAFNMSHQEADQLLGTVGAGFVPASVPDDVEPIDVPDDAAMVDDADGGGDVVPLEEAA